MPMNISTEHTIWCDRCHAWDQQPVRLKRAFVKTMRKAGWATREKQTVCPDCVKELAAGRAWDDVGYRSPVAH